MSPLRLAAVAIAALWFSTSALAQQDVIGLPGPIDFEGTRFELAWTSQPSPVFAKQEYLPAGQAFENYEEMFFVDVLTGDATPLSAAEALSQALERRRATDPLVNYDLIANPRTGEYILDFTLSDTSTGAIVVEWNAYRYVPNDEGVALFAISRRGYGDEGTAAFIAGLGEWRASTIEALSKMNLPQVALD